MSCISNDVAFDVARWLNTGGLILDIFGVCLVSWSLMRMTKEQAADQGVAVLDVNPGLLKLTLRQRLQTRIGVGLIVSGFLLQIAGTWCT